MTENRLYRTSPNFREKHVVNFSSILIMLLFSAHFVVAQEKAGLTTSNFGGINAAQLNPAATFNSKLFLDINFLGGGFFLENNFLYIHKEDYNFINYLSKNPQLPSFDIAGEGLDYNRAIQKVDGFQRNDLMGPSFSIALGKIAFGVFMKATTVTSVNDLPDDIAVLMFEGLQYDTLYGVQNINGKFDSETLGWGEVGINFSCVLSEKRQNRWSGGINIRRLFGFGSVYINNQSTEYTLVNDTTIDINNLEGESGFSLPYDYDENIYPDNSNFFKGKGYAVDLGVMYEKKMSYPSRSKPKKFCSYAYEDYLFKAGLSLIDLGSVRFSDNAQVHAFSDIDVYWDEIDTLEFENLNTTVKDLSQVFYGDTAASLKATSFKIGLPAALSFQADYQYYQNWFLNTTIVLPIKISNVQLSRPAQAIVSLRYESRWLELGFPLSLYDFQKPRLGLFARIYFFSFGTEKLGGFFNYSDFTGLDFYFSVKYNILKGDCDRYKPLKDCRHLSF